MIVSKVGTLLGDLHTVKAVCIPPCFQIGEHKRIGHLANEYRIITRILHVGDILVSRSWGYLSNSLIKGAFKHAMIYTGPVSGHRTLDGFIKEPKMLPSNTSIYQTFSPRTITHAISEGVVCQDLLEVMLHCDYLAIFRPSLMRSCLEDCGNIIAHEALSKTGLPYDFGFNWRSHKSFCCTELVDHCVKAASIPVPEQCYARTPIKKRKITFADNYFSFFPLMYYTPQCGSLGFVSKAVNPDKMMTAMRMIKG